MTAPPPNRRAAFSLLEILLALALLSLVVGLVFGVYQTTLRVMEHTTRRVVPRAACHEALAELRARLMGACVLGGLQGEPPLQLASQDEASPDGRQRLVFWTAQARGLPGDYVIVRSAWQLGGQGGGTGLLEEQAPAVGPVAGTFGSPRLWASGVEAFRVEAYDGETWHAAWPVGSAAWPRLLRLTLRHPAGGSNLTTTVFLPVSVHAEEL